MTKPRSTTRGPGDAGTSGRDAGLASPDDDRSNCGIGGIVDLDGTPTHGTVTDAVRLLENLEHRGTTGAESNTGDGAGIMVARPDAFFREVVDADLPPEYAVGSLFMPSEPNVQAAIHDVIAETFSVYGLEVLAWRSVPTDNTDLGATALDSEPEVEQLFVAPVEGAGLAARFADDGSVPSDTDPETLGFDRALYAARREIENTVADLDGAGRFYVCSLDRRRVVYKGLLKGSQIADYYPDLTDDRFASHVALVHARFSTNTLGAWHLAHPYRNVVHNGEFNTIRGNINWMRARENDLEHPAFGPELETLKPIINDPNQSDTASVDNALELLLQTGRDLPHALRMLVPEAFRDDHLMDEARRDFYDYHASLVEPWDGPALVIGFDGETVAGVLDRNGLRPCRYEVTDDNRLVVGSEVGALPTDAANVTRRGRLQPGEIFVADPERGRIVPDDDVFADLTDEKYGRWVAEHQADLENLVGTDDGTAVGFGDVDGADADAGTDDGADADPGVDDGADENDDAADQDPGAPTVRAHQAAFGYTTDSLDHLVEPMAESGKDPVGSMGDDTPLSVLADVDRPLFSYFKQLFAQVSNPPIDYIREELVTSLESRIGGQRNLLDETPEHAHQIVADSPVLTDAETAALKRLGGDEGGGEVEGEKDDAGFVSETIDATYHHDGSLVDAVARLRDDAAAAIEGGADVVVVSDRAVDPDRLAVPSLLATGAVHHHLVRNGLRNRAGLVVESGEPHEVHHLATLVGYGADAVDPYLAYASIADVVAGPDGANEAEALASYRSALEDGLLKTMAKMGISTVESYQGAQIFEAVGLDSRFVGEFFEGTEIRTEGIGIEGIEDDLRARHAMAFGADPQLETIGEYENRSSGVHHGWNPQTVGTLQQAVRGGDYEQYEEFADLVNDQSETLQTLRGLLAFDSDRDPVPVETVEPVEEIVERFSTAPMSLGSLSPEAHENNSIAMNRLGAKSNTGEGGEPPERFGTETECSVKQVASGRFGVTAEYLASADELQIKMAQGSKPGEGGHLPGEKVNEMIAHVRCSTPGVGLISPPPQHDIYSIEDLKQLIFDLKAANSDADVNVKLVSEAGIGTIAAGVAKANADVVHVSGHSGGTGASPKTSIKNAGLPWELGLAETNQMLRATGLRDRIRVTADGGLKTGRDVAVAAALGAEEYVFGTASLVTSGCVMARQCHENTCPVGVATQREDLRKRFPGEPEHVINYMTFIAQELRELMAELGYTDLEELIGRPGLLTQRETDHEKARHVDLSAVIAEPAGETRVKTREQDHPGIDGLLDWGLIDDAEPALADGSPVALTRDVDNVDRAVGAALSNRVVSEHGGEGLPDDTVTCRFDGYAGQSFGAFLAPGITLELTGAANDYVGKGLSGGRVVIDTPADAGYDPAENVVAGNVCLYGATSGEAYVNGVAGERFGVRNSGVKAVVEGVGDHGCEYMTGGVVAVLGDTGRNFAAGMSGGVAYVYDPDDRLDARLNRGMVSLSTDLDEGDRTMLRRLVDNHRAYTDSDRAAELLDDWAAAVEDFVRVFPDAYAAVIAEGTGTDVREDLPEPADAVPGAPVDAAGHAPGDD